MNNALEHLERFRKVAFWEGISYVILLFIAMPLKYGASMPMAVKVVGMAHGILFIAYCACLALAALSLRWSPQRSFLAFLVSLIPFATFLFDKSLRSESEAIAA